MRIPKEIKYFQVFGKNKNILRVKLRNGYAAYLKGKITQKRLNSFKGLKLKTLF